MTPKKSVVGKYARMTADDLRSETAEFDKEMVTTKSKPLTAEERAWWERVRRRPGRPRRGRGAKVISVSLEQELLARSDALAKNLGISRALLIERGLKAVLAAEGRLCPPCTFELSGSSKGRKSSGVFEALCVP